MEAFNNLSGTNKLLIILGVIGIPFCTYVFIQDFTKEDDTADISSNYEADAEPSLLLPSPSDESNSTNDEISKIEKIPSKNKERETSHEKILKTRK